MSGVLDEVWDDVIGGMDWLKQVIYGQFDDNRALSAVVADMLISFVPGVIIVTSARDLTAVTLRMVRNPQKREQLEEWMLIIGCVIPLVLPILAAAAGVAAAGVGAIVGGIAGSEAGAVLRATCLLLIDKGGILLAELTGFLRRFIKGDILKVLRDINFAQYGTAIVKYFKTFTVGLMRVSMKVRERLASLPFASQFSDVISQLRALENEFYAVQTAGISKIPLALAELDSRLAKVLTEALSHRPHAAFPGAAAPKPKPIAPPTGQKVPAMSSNPLGLPEGASHTFPPRKVTEEPNLHPEDPKQPRLKANGETKVRCLETDQLPASKFGEMDRQLAMQQDGLNKMSVQQYLDGRALYENQGRGSGWPAQQARAEFQEKLTVDLKDQYQYQNPDVSEADAKSWATKEAKNQMSTLAALHNPDQKLGGANAISGFGDRQVNSTIGSQWVRPYVDQAVPGAGKTTRAAQMDVAANSVPISERSTTTMNVVLERCK